MLFPAPLAPTIATTSPRLTRNETLQSTGAFELYANVTSSNSIAFANCPQFQSARIGLLRHFQNFENALGCAEPLLKGIVDPAHSSNRVIQLNESDDKHQHGTGILLIARIHHVGGNDEHSEDFHQRRRQGMRHLLTQIRSEQSLRDSAEPAILRISPSGTLSRCDFRKTPRKCTLDISAISCWFERLNERRRLPNHAVGYRTSGSENKRCQ